MQTNQSVLMIHLTDALSQQNVGQPLWQNWIHGLRAYAIIGQQAPINLSIEKGVISFDLSQLSSEQSFQLCLVPSSNSLYSDQAVNIVALNQSPIMDSAGKVKVADRVSLKASDWQNQGNQIELTLLAPAIVVDCRQGAVNPALSSEQLAYLQANGNNATIFIHGFNVPVGSYGPAMAAEQGLGYSLYREPGLDPNANGTGAYNWFVCMEYNLNVAAGFDGKDFSKYTRIIGIIWDGDPPSILDYILAVKEAGCAANSVLAVIKQLLQHNIHINLMAHSLGNQVLLKTIEALGQDPEYAEAIDHIFMWEAAIPDNSFSDPAVNQDFSKDYRFPNAHNAFKKATVLFSQHDNILGPVDKKDPDMWQKMQDPSGGIIVAGIAEIISWFDSFNIADHIKSVYNIANMFGTPFSELLNSQDYRKSFYQRWVTLHPSNQHSVAFPSSLEEQKAHFEQTCPDPYNALSLMFGGLEKGLLRGILDSEFDLVSLRLKQWAKLPEKWIDKLEAKPFKPAIVRDKVGNDMAALIITVFISQNAEPRPAMGYSGPLVSDAVTLSLVSSHRLFTVDQTAYYFTHSACRIPSPDVMKLTYQDQLMGNGPQAFEKFGLYRP
ncbi:MAG: hypothetical protein K0Q57_779 [Gammaproteobacteria bacterium]|jgi:hypothetical protein|nr:hypothetical protein [Gammaproteobacteria bacterium]